VDYDLYGSLPLCFLFRHERIIGWAACSVATRMYRLASGLLSPQPASWLRFLARVLIELPPQVLRCAFAVAEVRVRREEAESASHAGRQDWDVVHARQDNEAALHWTDYTPEPDAWSVRCRMLRQCTYTTRAWKKRIAFTPGDSGDLDYPRGLPTPCPAEKRKVVPSPRRLPCTVNSSANRAPMRC
jgi:hypothetical protein